MYINIGICFKKNADPKVCSCSIKKLPRFILSFAILFVWGLCPPNKSPPKFANFNFIKIILNASHLVFKKSNRFFGLENY